MGEYYDSDGELILTVQRRGADQALCFFRADDEWQSEICTP
ncbi:hypothetical protein ACIBL3_20575 [Kribbella sp. NPDC050124]